MTIFHNLFGLHTYEVLQEEEVCLASIPVARIIVCRCSKCGRIETYKVPLTYNSND